MPRPPRTRKNESIKKDEEDTNCLCFQDALQSYLRNDDEGEGGAEIANALFELANATDVSYRIDRPQDVIVRIRQDHDEACGQHTGGIVWETSYLLLNYLRQIYSPEDATRRSKYPCGKTVLEVGAGCGLLGIGIYHSKLAKRVILTETDSVLPNLLYNVQRNTIRKNLEDETNERVRVCGLDWTRYEEDCRVANIEPHSIDFIVGTDVVFSTRFVRPLLETLRYLAHSQTTILLCLQERCPDSHRLLLESASDCGLTVQDISDQVTEVHSCEWGRDLECCILHMQVDGELKRPMASQNKRQKHGDRHTVKKLKSTPMQTL
jgi:hypothetical protein